MPRSGGSGSSVQWKPYFEEKIILDSHPDEHSHRWRRAAREQENERFVTHISRLDGEGRSIFNGHSLGDNLDGSIASSQGTFGLLNQSALTAEDKESSKKEEDKIRDFLDSPFSKKNV